MEMKSKINNYRKKAKCEGCGKKFRLHILFKHGDKIICCRCVPDKIV